MLSRRARLSIVANATLLAQECETQAAWIEGARARLAGRDDPDEAVLVELCYRLTRICRATAAHSLLVAAMLDEDGATAAETGP